MLLDGAARPKYEEAEPEGSAEKKKREEAVALEKKKKEEAAAAAAAATAATAAAEKKRLEDEALAKQQAAQPHKAQPRFGATTPRSDSVVVIAHDPSEEEEKLKRLEEHKDDPDAHHGLPDTTHAHAERHEFVKRGNHTDEMDLNDYVIVGAFRGKENAQKFHKGLTAMGFNDSDYGFITARNIWYVYVYSGNDLAVVRTERDKYRKMKMFKDAWLLTVHE